MIGSIRSLAERLEVHTARFQVSDASAKDGVIEVEIKLAPAEIEFLKNYDALLSERRAKK